MQTSQPQKLVSSRDEDDGLSDAESEDDGLWNVQHKDGGPFFNHNYGYGYGYGYKLPPAGRACGHSMGYEGSRLEEAIIDAQHRFVKQELKAGRLKFSPVNAFSQVKKEKVRADPTTNKSPRKKISSVRGNNKQVLVNDASNLTGIANGSIFYKSDCTVNLWSRRANDDEDEDLIEE